MTVGDLVARVSGLSAGQQAAVRALLRMLDVANDQIGIRINRDNETVAFSVGGRPVRTFTFDDVEAWVNGTQSATPEP